MGLISRHKDKNGRSFNIKTTPKFAEYFKLKGDAKTLARILEVDKGITDEDEPTAILPTEPSNDEEAI